MTRLLGVVLAALLVPLVRAVVRLTGAIDDFTQDDWED